MKSVYLKKKKKLFALFARCAVFGIFVKLCRFSTRLIPVSFCVLCYCYSTFYMCMFASPAAQQQGQCANPYPLLHCIKMNMC